MNYYRPWWRNSNWEGLLQGHKAKREAGRWVKRGKKPGLELKQFTFVWRAGSHPPGWGQCWKSMLLWHAVCFCIHTGEEPGPQMACSQLCQPQTDLWTFYLYNSLVSLSLFLYNWQFAGFAVIRLLVIHSIKKRKSKRLVSLQGEVFLITTTQLRWYCYLLILFPFARFWFTYLNMHFSSKYFLNFHFFKDWRT